MTNNNIVFGKREHAKPIAIQMPVSVPQIYTGPDRRDSARRKMLKACKIIFNNNYSVFDGVIVNIGDKGARLKAANTSYIANEFLLSTVFGNNKYLCNIVWRDKEFIGVEFSDI